MADSDDTKMVDGSPLEIEASGAAQQMEEAPVEADSEQTSAPDRVKSMGSNPLYKPK